MSIVRHHKVVAALPAELEPNAIYYVRRGAGFDTYVTNSAGLVVAYPLNSPVSVRERLTASRTYYVRTDGSDSNTGLTNDAAGAFLTIQKAIDVAAVLDIGIFTITISVGAGLAFPSVILKDPVGSGQVVIAGAGSSVSGIEHAGTSGAAIAAGASTKYTIRDLAITAPNGTARGVTCTAGGSVILSNVAMGVCGGYHFDASGGVINLLSYLITGGALIHWYAANGGRLIAAGITVTLAGSLTFPLGFSFADVMGLLRVNANTFAGSATGKRYSSNGGSVIYTAGAGANYLPGTIDGTTSGGIYT